VRRTHLVANAVALLRRDVVAGARVVRDPLSAEVTILGGSLLFGGGPERHIVMSDLGFGLGLDLERVRRLHDEFQNFGVSRA
jgi:hypothetical protein